MKKHPYVVSRRDFILNAKRQIFGDKRTKRCRDRSNKNRKSIDQSRDEQ